MVHEVPVDGVLDLHCFAPRDVSSIVTEYLCAAAATGLREVRFIHGRGTGVQRSIVQATVERHPVVKEFWDAPESHLGATVVVLIPTKPTKSRLSKGVKQS